MGAQALVDLVHVEQALQDLLSAHTQQEIGAAVGVAHTTIGRHGLDLHGWPANHLLMAARRWPELGRSVGMFIAGEAKEAPAADVVRASLETVAAMSRSSASLVSAVADHRLTPVERRAIRHDLAGLIQVLQHLHDDLGVAP